MIARPKRNKYNARRTEADGRVFDSNREAAVYLELKVSRLAGDIIGDIEFQPEFPLVINGIKITKRPYRADFRFVDATGATRILDVKGVDTREGKLRRKLAEAIHGVTIEVVK